MVCRTNVNKVGNVFHSRFYSVAFDVLLGVTWANLLVATERPLKRAPPSRGSVHDDVIKWKHFPRYWPFVLEIHRSRWISRTKAIDTELWCLFDLRLNKRLSKQSWSWWIETLSHPLWRHRNGGMVVLEITGAVCALNWLRLNYLDISTFLWLDAHAYSMCRKLYFLLQHL